MELHMKYTVLRAHEGDKAYAVGDTRELAPIDAAQLVWLGVLKAQEEKPVIETKPKQEHETKVVSQKVKK